MNVKSRPLATHKLVKFEKQPLQVQDFRQIANHFTGTYEICLINNDKSTKINML